MELYGGGPYTPPHKVRELQERMIYDTLRCNNQSHETATVITARKLQELKTEAEVWSFLRAKFKQFGGTYAKLKAVWDKLLEIPAGIGIVPTEVKEAYVKLYGGGPYTPPQKVRELQERMIYDTLRWNKQTPEKATKITDTKLQELKTEAEVWSFLGAKFKSIGLTYAKRKAFVGSTVAV